MWTINKRSLMAECKPSCGTSGWQSIQRGVVSLESPIPWPSACESTVHARGCGCIARSIRLAWNWAESKNWVLESESPPRQASSYSRRNTSWALSLPSALTNHSSSFHHRRLSVQRFVWQDLCPATFGDASVLLVRNSYLPLLVHAYCKWQRCTILPSSSCKRTA